MNSEFRKMAVTKEFIACVCVVVFSGGILIVNEFRMVLFKEEMDRMRADFSAAGIQEVNRLKLVDEEEMSASMASVEVLAPSGLKSSMELNDYNASDYAELLIQLKELQNNCNSSDMVKLKAIEEQQQPRFFFTAKRTSSFTSSSSIVTYEQVDSNGERMMDAKSGVFTVGIEGTYVLNFNGLSNVSGGTRVDLVINGVFQTSSYVPFNYSPLSLTSIVRLKMGDQVAILLSYGELFENYNSNKRFYTQFSGFLLSDVAFIYLA